MAGVAQPAATTTTTSSGSSSAQSRPEAAALDPWLPVLRFVLVQLRLLKGQAQRLDAQIQEVLDILEPEVPYCAIVA